jgi:MFS transporter, DHA3 family, macrolide efflux protein
MKPERNVPGTSLRGMAGFTLVWVGQLVSVLASNMSSFALTIWAYQETGSATTLGLVSACFTVPFILISPIAGAMVDRYDRRLMMMVSDLGAVAATAAILVLKATGRLALWQYGAAAVIYGLSGAFQWPAYMAAITTMVPKRHLGRANGMMMLVESGPGVFSPVLAGLLLPVIGLTGILAIDVVTFFIAIGALFVVSIPRPAKTAEGQAVKGNLLTEGLYGFRYIFERRSLVLLLGLILCLNFAHGLAGSLVTPMVLSRTGNNAAVLGTVDSAFAIGGVAGGAIISAWGGFKRKRIRGMFLGWGVSGLFGLIGFGLGRGLAVWLPMAAVSAMAFPLSQSASNTIWQSKVAPDIQGRVFSARRMLAWMLDPVMPVVAGLIADKVMEPAMRADTWLARTFTGITGGGPGSGMSFQFIAAGLIYLVFTVIALSTSAVRDVETILPDHEQVEKAAGDPRSGQPR